MFLTKLWDFYRRLVHRPSVDWPDTVSEPGYLGDNRALATDIVGANFGNAMEHLMRDLLWKNGWFQEARRVDANPGRLGGPIVPRSAVVHTTDMLDGFDGLVRGWVNNKGAGNAAHFLLGRTPAKGLVQFAPITVNANHAGGRDKRGNPSHGWYKDQAGVRYHPNLATIGIEVDNGGRLDNRGTKTNPRLVHRDSGRTVPIADAYHHEPTGTWWHALTDYQWKALRLLVNACIIPLKSFPSGTFVVPNGSYADNGVRWADLTGRVNVVGHVTLDPTRKTDPGPAVINWIRENY